VTWYSVDMASGAGQDLPGTGQRPMRAAENDR
jgi:hypothetical protein